MGRLVDCVRLRTGGFAIRWPDAVAEVPDFDEVMHSLGG